MLKKFIFPVIIVFLIARCNSPTTPVVTETNEEKPLRIITTQSVNDTVINYGCYPILPTGLDVVLNDRSKKKLEVNWNALINPILPGTYYATSHVTISEQGIQDDSVTFAISIKNTDSVLTTDKDARLYLGYGYDTANNFLGMAINHDCMYIYEKPINQIQYIYRVIETEKDRIQFHENLNAFLGFKCGIATNTLAEGEIEIVQVFYFRYKTYLLEGNLKFLPLADSLYHANHEVFNMLWGQMYSQQVTLCRFGMGDMVFQPEGLSKQELAAKISQLLETMDQSSTKLMETKKLFIKQITTQSSLGGIWPWPFSKSTNQIFKDFKNEIDSTMTSREYYVANQVYKKY